MRSGTITKPCTSQIYNIRRNTILDHLPGGRGTTSSTQGGAAVVPFALEARYLAKGLSMTERYGFV